MSGPRVTLLRENQQKYFWQNETVAAGTLSIAFEIARVNRSYYPWGLSVEVVFSAAHDAARSRTIQRLTQEQKLNLKVAIREARHAGCRVRAALGTGSGGATGGSWQTWRRRRAWPQENPYSKS